MSGKIRGAAFKVADARYFVDKRRGYEHVDIQLNASAAGDVCGPLTSEDMPTVWLRRSGVGPITAGEVRVTPKSKGPWEVHYQAKERHGWIGNGDAAALVVVREIRNDGSLVGDLSVCFADGQKSCVSGSFVAHSCPIRIDAPVRGIEVPETPEAYLRRRAAAGSSAAPLANSSANAPPEGRSPR